MDKAEQKQLSTKIVEIVRDLRNCGLRDLAVSIKSNRVIVGLNIQCIGHNISGICSFPDWLYEVNGEVYSKTDFKLKIDSNERYVYFLLKEADFDGTNDVVEDFGVVIGTILNIIDRSLEF